MEDTNIKERKGTTVILDDEAYNLIMEKQMKIYSGTKEKVSIQKLVSESVKKGIPLLDSSASQV